MDFEAAAESLDGGVYVVSVTGEVDLATGPEFQRALLALPDQGVASVIVDLTDCSFMDSTGLHLPPAPNGASTARADASRLSRPTGASSRSSKSRSSTSSSRSIRRGPPP
jgi:hypothetical protein